MRYKRIIILILDGCGCGVQSDYKFFHSRKTNTLGNLYKKDNSFRLPLLERLGLSQILFLGRDNANAVYGRMRETSSGNDTFTGVWEMMGFKFAQRFNQNKGLGKENIDKIRKNLPTPTICNRYISGYKVLDKYYQKHVSTKYPILYLADDGVILLAGHEMIISSENLIEYASRLQLILKDRGYSRIITRPFTKNPGSFERLESHRKDFLLTDLPELSLINELVKQNIEVRITDHLYNLFGKPANTSVLFGNFKTRELLFHVSEDIKNKHNGLFMYVIPDTDNYGHKKDLIGFKESLRTVDDWLAGIITILGGEDLLIITADHGCDPTVKMRGHSREYVPLMVYNKNLNKGLNLGERSTFTDLGQTILYNYDCVLMRSGKYFNIFRETNEKLTL